ncbi:hypothetical protein BN1211_1727 [Cyberlindnera jadinii]|uniref:AMP-activated protein kinase glycogen-binding domain-containing protein n=1 Tax=Cyberlindnera jadinii (strain ATCC 18201 / CBS 1600 / BCRC 20928 / JCM 3617 / NBRC 0987 / NRRL Y-1542) TaxID=983966 RepID=A0A0H5C214_CYBJN|nr:hypothetical protein BN1211_1727 [Cyberlindnera jadinii]
MKPAGPSEVIVTGTFDNWTQSLPLVKTSKGDFEITLPLQQKNGEDKVSFKFVVDGDWHTSDEYEIEHDNGNSNNVIFFSNLIDEKKEEVRIPESGGLPITTASSEGESKTTVLPSTEGQQDTSATGEPGIVIPSNAKDIKEFSEVSDVDAKELNAKLNAETTEAAETSGLSTTVLPSNEGKQDTSATGEPGIVIPANAEDIKEFSEVSDVNAKELNAKLNGAETVGTETLSTTVLPSTEGQQDTSATGDAGIVVPTNAKDIKEFSEVSDVNAKELNEKLNSEDKKTKTVKVKKVIKRNKVTGEETVVSSTPLEDGDEIPKSLDPKVEKPVEAAATSTPSETVAEKKEAVVDGAKKAEEVKATPAPKAQKKTAEAPKKEEKKGFFRRLKKKLL